MKISNYKFPSLSLILLMFLLITSCEDDEGQIIHGDPAVIITDVSLVFTNVADATDVVTANAQDPDREGVESLQALGPINLDANKTYRLTFEIFNNLESPGDNLTLEIEEEATEYQMFFSFTTDAFSSPAGDGNIDTASDPINYGDQDDNGNPLGLITTWDTGSTAVTGTFTARLQVQPDEKTATSTATTGDTDFDLTFILNIQ